MTGSDPKAIRERARMKKVSERSSSESKSDSDLIQMIATGTDREAFTELFRRYEKMGYQVAKHITFDHHLAEEAFLDAMHRIWRSAHSFDPEGNARGWIIRIIARSSLMCLKRKGKRIHTNVEDVEKLGELKVVPKQSMFEKTELVSGLKDSLGDLSPTDRNIIALRFVGGLSQKEIGKELSMSQRTISERIRQSLDILRRSLTRAGLGAALPLLAADGIRDAICLNVPERPRFANEVLDKILETESARGKMLSPWISVALVTVGLACSVIAWQFRASLASLSGSQAENTEETSTALGADLRPKYYRLWDFNTLDLKGLSFSEDGWKHVSSGGMDGSGCMRIASKSFLDVGIKISQKDLPVEVKINVKMKREVLPNSLLSWEGHAPDATIHSGQRKSELLNRWVQFRCFATRDTVSVWLDDQLLCLALGNDGKGRQLSVRFVADWKVDNLEVRSVSRESLPDIALFSKAVNEIPPENRQHFHLLPGLTQANSKQENRIFRAVFRNPPRKLKLETQTQTWRFRKSSALHDFALANGTWRYLPEGGKNGTGCVEMAQQQLTVFFNCNFRKAPFVVTARFRGRPTGKAYDFPNFFWVNLNGEKSFTRIPMVGSKIDNRHLRNKWVTVKYYVTNHYIDMWVENTRAKIEVLKVNQFGMPHLFSNFRTQMDFLEIKSIDQKDLPKLRRYRAEVDRLFGLLYGEAQR